MIEERKTEEFEDDRKKWKIHFNMPENSSKTVIVSLISQMKEGHLTPKDLEKLKQDLKDLGKLRIIKQGKEFLEK